MSLLTFLMLNPVPKATGPFLRLHRKVIIIDVSFSHLKVVSWTYILYEYKFHFSNHLLLLLPIRSVLKATAAFRTCFSGFLTSPRRNNLKKNVFFQFPHFITSPILIMSAFLLLTLRCVWYKKSPPQKRRVFSGMFPLILPGIKNCKKKILLTSFPFFNYPFLAYFISYIANPPVEKKIFFLSTTPACQQ